MTRGDTGVWRAAAATAGVMVVGALLGGCSADTSPPDRAVGTNEPTAPTPSTPSTQDASTSPTGGAEPLTLDGAGRVCLSLGRGPDYTHWDHVLTPSTPVAIEHVRLVGAENIAAVGRGFVAPQPEGIPVSGWSNGWPIGARSAASDRLAWADRVPALGAELDAGQGYNLFVHLRLGDSGAPAAYDALEVHYTAAGERHVARDRVRVEVRRRCS